MNEQSVTYDTGVNILGSIPNYADVIQYIVSMQNKQEDKNFVFRTSHSTERFKTAIESHIMKFVNDQHRCYFVNALSSTSFTLFDKYLIIFWQLIYANYLFRRLTGEVYMRAVYQGRSIIRAEELLSFLHFIKENEKPKDITWSEATIKIIASKYLTLLKKLGLAEGTVKKQIKHPMITNDLFVWFIRWCQLVYPNDRTLKNPYIQFGFMDKDTLINRLKKIENIQYWNISQIGDDVTIDLKPYE